MSIRLQILVPEALEVRIQKAAQRKRMSKGAWVRSVLEKELVRETTHGDPLTRLGKLNAPTGSMATILKDVARGRGLS